MSDATEPAIALQPIAAEDAAVLGNLVQLYAHDFSEHVQLELKPNGRFDVPIGETWWTRADHFPFFIKRGGELAGFALVRSGSRVTGVTSVTSVAGVAGVMDVAEFFVARGLRRHGVGTHAAHLLFRAFPGPWEIRVRRSNTSAKAFWSKVIERWTGSSSTSVPITAEGVDWDVLSTSG